VTRALVVASAVETRSLLRAALESQGLEVDEVSEVAEALAKAQEHPPDVLVTDLLTRGMDGFALLRRWKADERLRTIPVVVVVATHQAPDDEALTTELGADAVFRRPAEPGALAGCLREVLGARNEGARAPPRRPSGDKAAQLERHNQILARELERTWTELDAAKRQLAEREEIETALRASEARYRRMVQTSEEGVWSIDAGGRTTFVNPRIERMLGFTAEEMLGRAVTDFLDDDGRQRFAERRERRSSGVAEQYDVRLVRKDGSFLWAVVATSPITDAAGTFQGALARVSDITDRKQTEAALRESDELFRALMDHSMQGTALFEGERMVYANPALLAITGANEMELFMESQAGLLARVHPDDHARAIERAERARRGEPVDQVDEMRLLRPDGEWRWALTTTKSITLHGRPARLAMHIDITDRKEAELSLQRSEARFRALIEGAADLIGVADAKGRVLYQSPSTERVLGYPTEELRALKLLELVHPDDAAAVGAMTNQAHEAGGTPLPVAFRVRHRDGSWRRIDAVCRSLPEQSPEGFIVMNARDVTERYALEQQLARSQKLQAMGTLAGGIAHDFNNLLAVILGNADLARRDLPGAHPASESVGEIVDAAHRARELVRRILLFSRPHEHVLRTIDLAPVAAEAVKLLRSTLPAGVELRFHVARGLPLVRADAFQLDQIIFNLATNAWHAMEGEAGEIDVRLEACRVDSRLRERAPELQPGPYVRLSVRDTGRGMDEATHARIFEPFFTTKPTGEGTGLGLSVVHGIVRSHGGSVVVESRLGRGTTVDVYLPAVAGTSDARVAERSPTDLRGQGEHILYIDDETSLVFLAVRFLTRLGYRVTGEALAAKAIEVFRADPRSFDIVITDLNMPGMSGLEVARQLLAIQPDARVVLASGYLESSDVERAKAIGVREVVMKPNTVEELGPLVSRLLAAPPTAAPR
jgi:PAS domain S-box-containing protein